MDGIIPLNKERGMTSFDCVRKMRGILRTKKIGHSGTLDPNVDGVLPICVGSATKVVDFLMNSGKIYRGEITLGFSTTTEDLDGEIVNQKPIITPFSEAQINQAMQQLVQPRLLQIPPMYSAVKVNGRRLYEYARAGETVKRPERHVRIDYFKMTAPVKYDATHQLQKIKFEVGCGKGTYVRTLSFMVGQLLGVPAVMSDLTRIKSGGFTLDESYSISQIEAAVHDDCLADVMYPIDHALNDFPSYALNPNQWKIVQNGGFLAPQDIKMDSDQIAVQFNHQIKALYYLNHDQGVYKPLKMFSVK
ncbi:tRNA pseudouridine(55) synthase TruB [Nicoliella spurrieriana]|uniref:tRNA pseudouridine synthase B n=1 Tax=Nicoliella spurrieriana TaxID=2925830 RepID=A0A976RRE9_9LACO|nr:tRNA pseudouridine(55) synthase TruB [Nicoliella spurrieriana]UQS86510.1 tRNA pseudouridine(55) synthase TruB [Nicoliella spurrieriana]